MNTNKKPSTALVLDDIFVLNGEVGKFLHRTGRPYNTRYGSYQRVWVLNGEGNTVQWSLNTAGSVTVL